MASIPPALSYEMPLSVNEADPVVEEPAYLVPAVIRPAVAPQKPLRTARRSAHLKYIILAKLFFFIK